MKKQEGKKDRRKSLVQGSRVIIGKESGEKGRKEVIKK